MGGCLPGRVTSDIRPHANRARQLGQGIKKSAAVPFLHSVTAGVRKLRRSTREAQARATPTHTFTRKSRRWSDYAAPIPIESMSSEIRR